MPNDYVLGSFGIKEVADVAFYTVGTVSISDGTLTATAAPVLKFDTLKMSNLEFTGETAEARGGKGNTVLLSWDHSREATMTLEDALMSADTLNALLSSNSSVTTTAGGQKIINIDANGFPGTYTVVGQTYARSTDGHDHLLTIFIPKAKVQSEASLEMSADGDPSTLSMTLKVLRVKDATEVSGAAKGDLVKLIIAPNSSGGTPAMVFPEPAAATEPDATEPEGA